MKSISKDTKLTIQVVLASVLVFAGIVLLFMGFAVAPKGEIHNSVLIGAGETFTFAGALLGIEYAARTAVIRIKQDLQNDDKK
ncbi:MAG: hypothetical protein J6J25_04555 [Bacteroidales bacterium]|nr:hypothetical protein [Bacteroidales bacterium]